MSNLFLAEEEVNGIFKVIRVYRFNDDKQAFVFIHTPNGIRCIVFHCTTAHNRFFDNLTLPCSLRFSDGRMSVVE